MNNCVFSIDFTHETMTAAFVGLDGTDEDAAGFDLSDFMAGDSGPMDKLVGLLAAKCRAAQGGAKAVAIALPCDLDGKRETVISFPQAPWLNGCRLPEVVSSALGLPVVMERRAVAMLAYDRVMLGLPEDSLTVGCYVETHYENAIWHRGVPILGRHGSAGNICHMTIHDREDNCFCGKAGCVDLYGAGTRLRQMHGMIFPDTPMSQLFARHGEHQLVRDYLTMMAYPIAIEANLLDPEFIVIGGAIPSMSGFPRQFLEGEIRRLSYLPGENSGATFLASAASTIPGVIPAAQYALVKLGMV